MPQNQLLETLLAREVSKGGTVQPPPGITNRVPPAWKRWETAQKMQEAYRNNWTPNPIGVRIVEEN